MSPNSFAKVMQNCFIQGESSGRSTPSSDSAPGKLFVGGLSWQTNQDRLREYFGQFGTVTDVLVMKDPITQVGFFIIIKLGFNRIPFNISMLISNDKEQS